MTKVIPSSETIRRTGATVESLRFTVASLGLADDDLELFDTIVAALREMLAAFNVSEPSSHAESAAQDEAQDRAIALARKTLKAG